MNTLATLNGEAYAASGLRFWGRRANGSIAIICSDERGSVELWHFEHNPSRGGVELHSPVSLHALDFAEDDCAILDGTCFTDGTSLGYNDSFEANIAAGNSRAVLERLVQWHADQFGAVAVTR